MAHDAFISHSAKDKAVADAVCATLEARRIRCWIAPRDVPPGAPYAEALSDALQASRVLVLVLSAHANQSKHVMREVEVAVDAGLAILPFRIEDVQPSKSLGYYLQTIHWLDALTPPVEAHLQALADAVERLLASEPRPGAAATTDRPTTNAAAATRRDPVPAVTRSPWTARLLLVVPTLLVLALLAFWLRPAPSPKGTEATDASAGAAPGDAVAQDLERLQGRWEMVAIDRAGKRESVDAGDFAIEFRGSEHWAFDGTHEPTVGRVLIRPTEPRSVEEIFEYERDGQKRTGRIAWIYRFLGPDLLEMATPEDDSFDAPSPYVPKGFDSSVEPIDVSTFERRPRPAGQ